MNIGQVMNYKKFLIELNFIHFLNCSKYRNEIQIRILLHTKFFYYYCYQYTIVLTKNENFIRTCGSYGVDEVS